MTAANITRRAVLAGGTSALAAGIFAAHSSATPLNGSGEALEVHVIVIDGLRNDEVNPDLMPHVASLDSASIRYANANAIQIAETLPNHTAMMTGVSPARSGVPANKIYDRDERKFRNLDRPQDLTAPTILERLRTERGITTASVLSKDYLHGLFQGRATVHWNPAPLIPLTDHAPDAATMDALLRIMVDHSPRMTFTNLGDVDRVGHIDVTGNDIRLARTAAVRHTDTQVRRFVSFLKESGRWNRSVVILIADHSMDWSRPLSLISLHVPFSLDPMLRDNIEIADNGGASLWYWTGDPALRDDAVERMRQIAMLHPGIDSVHAAGVLNLGPRGGDAVAFCKPGWRFTDPTVLSNPIPGNHGHGVTLPIPLIVTGGHPQLPGKLTVSDAVTTMDVAPTVAALFGLVPPPNGWDGTALPAVM
ncbi:alkaline phosphatase family protein [Hoyosella rhizosphaerae]|uniref:Phosphodiesterase n=1 Tax=Hoyosella rhizosphaerae TaxID=1755582 RepID=A0A916XAP5_9ACTN|nr:alkaline phosphatase family protein [Hoyosella rhizosphaerae]MBN4926438.1 alkaline phosphatase family protein [Hoyosella rhizosphaerae]GGC59365.1 phosphodiesterase [Hoyosella rhizosphaerae]